MEIEKLMRRHPEAKERIKIGLAIFFCDYFCFPLPAYAERFGGNYVIYPYSLAGEEK